MTRQSKKKVKPIWKEVVGWSNYEVNQLGQVRNKFTKTLKVVNKNIWGYLQITLYSPKRRLKTGVHRLVAQAFCYKTYGANCVNHLDGNRTNNYYKNLEWVTHKANTSHAIKLRGNWMEGEKNGSAKLNRNQVNEIRRAFSKPELNRWDRGRLISNFSKVFKVSKVTIYYIVWGRSYKNLITPIIKGKYDYP